MSRESKSRTILEALKVCSRTKDLRRGREMHSALLENGCEFDVYAASSLINMYAKCSDMVLAQKVFDGIQHNDPVVWNSLILGYADNGDGVTALELLCRMSCDGCPPDARTFVAALKACTTEAVREKGEQIAGKIVKLVALGKGMAIHTEAAAHSCVSNTFVASILVDMYAKCGSIDRARHVFDGMPQRDVVCWNALILGYADNGDGNMPLELLSRMRDEGLEPDPQTYVGAVKACSILGALSIGKTLHAEICSRGFRNNVILATALIDLYAKCWSMEDAHRVFDALHRKDIVAWTALLSGYNHCGDTDQVFAVFDRMQKANMKPNRVTFICLLNACSHAGLIEKGKAYFEAMQSKFGVSPDVEHYSCVVDMLGRANRLEEAVQMVETMPLKPSAVTWMILLDACKKWNNIDILLVGVSQSAAISRKAPLQNFRAYNIAHRGSSGELPEETAEAYQRAIQEGADFIETDLMATKDGVLICLHDVTLDDTTNISDHPEFADRKATYEIEGHNTTGHFTADFTYAEIKTLRTKQRLSFRDQSFNDLYQIITFEEYISIALNASRTVGIYPVYCRCSCRSRYAVRDICSRHESL